MTIYFITGNENKFKEVKSMIPEVERMDMDLPEIQDIDPKEIIKAKLEEAMKHHDGAFIVEDTSLTLKAMNGLPGPLIKWFEQAIGLDGIANLAEKLGDDKAIARSMIGYATDSDNIHFFEGTLEGQIVSPREHEWIWVG